MTLNLEWLRETVRDIAFTDSTGDMRGKAMRLSEALTKIYAENAKELISNLAIPAKEWDAEHFPNAPEGDYLIRSHYASNWNNVICDLHGRGGDRDIYRTLQPYTKEETLALFAHKDKLERAEVAFGPIPKVPPFGYMSEHP